MNTEPDKPPRRRLTTEERLARLKSQEEMILKRAKRKEYERVEEAYMLLMGVPSASKIAENVRAWLLEHPAHAALESEQSETAAARADVGRSEA